MDTALTHEDYQVGWICALPIELAAASALLDRQHPPLNSVPGDSNVYVLGDLAGHNLVLACLPAGRLGTHTAATVAAQMMRSFPKLRFGLLVGIGGGVPSTENDIRLGDVVVSKPERSHGGVVQYDIDLLLSAVSILQSMQFLGKSSISESLSVLQMVPAFRLEAAGTDDLFRSDYEHGGGTSCVHCDSGRRIVRPDRKHQGVRVHYGTIASGNQIMRSGKRRDKISNELGGVLCFEMEAAGLLNSFPCLVIRGICDYADSHKNKAWQPFAAASAAAYAKELLSAVPVGQVFSIEPALEANNRAVSRVYSIPFQRNRDFVGRLQTLDTLKAHLFNADSCQSIAICGLGGIGKTQVALSLAYHALDHHPDFSVFCISALSPLSIEKSFQEIAARLGIVKYTGRSYSTRELVKQHLSAATAGHWLLIVDNVDNEESLGDEDSPWSLLGALPRNEQGVTLFTSRNLNIAHGIVRSQIIELGPMQPAEAMQLLCKSIRHPSALNNEAANSELLSELHYLPIAIVQAIAFINVKKISVSEYLRPFQATDEDMVYLLIQNLHDPMRYPDVGNAVATTWVISFNHIREHDADAFEMLCFIACIGWKAIPRSLLPKIGTEAAVTSAIGTLEAYSFASRSRDDETLGIHRLVHLAARVWLSHNHFAERAWVMAAQHAATVFPSRDWKNRTIWRAHLPHIRHLIDTDVWADAELRALLCLRGSECLLADGRLPEATQWLEQACHLTEHLCEEHELRLWARHTYAGVSIFNGQSEHSLKLLREVVRVRERTLPAGHPNLLASRHELGRAYLANGQTVEAVTVLEQVVEEESSLLPIDSADRLASQHVLARAYLDQGKHLAKATTLLEELVRIQNDRDVDDPGLLESQHELARVLIADGRQIERAIGILEHTVKVQTEFLHETHSNLLRSQHVLGRAYLTQATPDRSDFADKAVAVMEHVVRVRDKIFPEGNSYRLSSQQVLAEAFYIQGQAGNKQAWEKAQELMRHVAKVRKRVLPRHHPHRQQAKSLLTKTLELRSRQSET